jgi:hypothetical protein
MINNWAFAKLPDTTSDSGKRVSRCYLPLLGKLSYWMKLNNP